MTAADLPARDAAPDPDADEPAALPPRLARRRARGRVPWGMLALESFFTVVAILLALAADDWRQRREERALADGALRAFGAELAANRERVQAVLPYHVRLRAAVDSALLRGDAAEARSPRDVFPEFRGVRPVFLTHAAWESAVATGALRHMPPATLRDLSTTYELQSKLDALNGSMWTIIFDPAVMGAPDFAVPARIMSAYLADIVPMERELTGVYDRVLPGLREGHAP